MEQTRHMPVMMTEAVDALQLRKGMTVFDATLGGGGYAKTICDRIMPGGRMIACDRDADAITRFVGNERVMAQQMDIVHSNYSHIRKILKDAHVDRVDAIVADLGLSSDQLDETDRGFSFKHSGPIDMRMDQKQPLSALDIVNHCDPEELARIIYEYGDERFSRRIARAICAKRPIATTDVLAQVISDAIPRQSRRSMKMHPATRTFQSLRIAANDEYGHLKIFLTEGIELLRSGGRIAIVSFHSGEDRLVKNIFRTYARGCICAHDVPLCVCGKKPLLHIITKKPVMPTDGEIIKNPRARSARLRVAQKI